MSWLTNPISAIKNAVSTYVVQPVQKLADYVYKAAGQPSNVVTGATNLVKSAVSGAGNLTANLLSGTSGGKTVPSPVPGPTVGVPGTSYQSGQALITPSGSQTSSGGYYFPQAVPTVQYSQPIGPQQYTPSSTTSGGQVTSRGQVAGATTTQQERPFVVNYDAAGNAFITYTQGLSGGLGQSSYQFGGGTGVSGIQGGAQGLPGALSGGMRTAGVGGLGTYPTAEEEKRRKEQLVNKNNNTVVGDTMRNLFGIGTATAQTQQPTGQQGQYTGALGNAFSGIANYLTPDQINTANRVAATKTNNLQGAPFLIQPGTSGQTPILPKSSELSKQPINVVGGVGNVPYGPKSAVDQKIAQMFVDKQSASNDINNQYKQQALDTASQNAIKSLSDNSQQLFGQQLTPQQVQQYVSTNPDGSVLYDTTFQNIKNKIFSPVSGEPYRAEDFQFHTAQVATATPPQATNGNNAYYKDANNNVFRTSDNQPVKQGSPDPSLDWNKLGLNIDHINTLDQIQQSEVPKPPEQTEVDKLLQDTQKLIDEWKLKEPALADGADKLQERFMRDEGVADKKSLRNSYQSQINDILTVYESAATDVKDDPDFSKNLKARNLEYISNRQSDAVRVLQRNIDLLDNEIAQGEKLVAQKMQNALTDYNVWKDNMTMLTNQYDKLTARDDKEADNARQALQFLYSNPEMMKGITQAELDYISKNGTYPNSLTAKISKLTGNNFKSIIQTHPTAGTTQVWGVKTDGTMVPIGVAVPDVSQAAGSSGVVASTVNMNGVNYNVIKDKSTGAVLSMTPMGQAGSPSVLDVRGQFVNWLSTVKGQYTIDQLQNVASIFMPSLDISKDTALTATLKQYAGTKYNEGIGPNILYGANKNLSTIDPIQAFNTYQSGTTGGTNTGQYQVILQGPDGKQYGYTDPNDPEIQQALKAGYTKIK